MPASSIVKLYPNLRGTIRKYRIQFTLWLIITGVVTITAIISGAVISLFFLGLINLIIYWGILWRRQTFLYDEAKGTGAIITSYLLFKRKRTFDLKQITGIRLEVKTKRRQNEPNYTTTLYNIVFEGTDIKVTPTGERTFCRRCAKLIAAHLHVPLINQVYAGKQISYFSPKVKAKDLNIPTLKKWNPTSRLAPSELGLSLTERWKKHDIIFEKSENQALEEIQTKHGAEGIELHISKEQKSKMAITILLLISIMLAIVFSIIGMYPFALFMIVFSFLVGRFVVANMGKNIIRLSVTGIVQKHGKLSWGKEIPYEKIQEYITTSNGLFLVGDENSVEIGWTKNNKDNAFLYQYIPYHIEQSAPVVKD